MVGERNEPVDEDRPRVNRSVAAGSSRFGGPTAVNQSDKDREETMTKHDSVSVLRAAVVSAGLMAGPNTPGLPAPNFNLRLMKTRT